MEQSFSFPMSTGTVDGPLLVSVRSKVVLQFGQTPDSLLMLSQSWEGLQEIFVEKVQNLQEISNGEVHPCDASCHVFFITQQAIEFPQHSLKVDSCFLKSLLPSIFCFVFAVDGHGIAPVEILEDSPNGGSLNPFLRISSQEVDSSALVADVDEDSITLRDNLVSIDKVGKSDSWVFLDQLDFIFLEPLVSGLRSVDNLGIWYFAVFHEMPDPLSHSPDAPVSKSDRCFHKRYVKYYDNNSHHLSTFKLLYYFI